MTTEQGLLDWTTNLERNGLCVIGDTPCVDGEVVQLASRIAPVVPTLYGDYWNVRAEQDPINVAYSMEHYLCPRACLHHFHLADYCSPPRCDTSQFFV